MSMEKLRREICETTGKEYVRACNEWGDVFASLHEGYGVIAEEVQEACDEQERIMTSLGDLLYKIREGSPDDVENVCHRIERYARLMACESVQVAAMARKMVHTLHKDGQQDPGAEYPPNVSPDGRKEG